MNVVVLLYNREKLVQRGKKSLSEQKRQNNYTDLCAVSYFAAVNHRLRTYLLSLTPHSDCCRVTDHRASPTEFSASLGH